jgi:hypothetical protein
VNLSLLTEKYKPKSAEEMLRLINRHAKMPIATMVLTCYNNQNKFLPVGVRYTQAEIKEYIVELFTKDTVAGMGKEEEMIAELQERYPQFKFIKSTKFDTEYRVDFAVADSENRCLCGVQVKPESYSHVSDSIKAENEKRNKAFTTQYKAPVIYGYYNNLGGLIIGNIIAHLERFANPDLFKSNK